MNVNEPKVYKTSDLYFAAFLKTSALIMKQPQREGNRILFVFEDKNDGNVDRLKMDFLNGTCKVIARDYADNIKALKSLCHMS
jgi:hypothetical protein